MTTPREKRAKVDSGRRAQELALGEEAVALLRVIVERQGYRQLMVANIRGHGLKFVPTVEDKARLAQDLSHSLKIYEEVERLYHQLGGGDLHDTVRSKMERIPYPASRLEFSVCLVLCDLAEQVASRTYMDSSCKEFAAVARSLVEMIHSGTPMGAELFLEYARDPANRPHARQMFDRWFAIGLRSLGRPGTQGDERAVALGLRSTRASDSIGEFVEAARRFLEPSGMPLPTSDALGLELPEGLLSSAG